MISDTAQLAVWGYALAAVAFFLFGLYVLAAQRGRGAGGALLAALMASALWCGSSALFASGVPYASLATVLTGIAREAAWFWFVLQLIRQIDVRHRRWPALMTIALIGGRMLTVFIDMSGVGVLGNGAQNSILLQLLSGIYMLVLAEHLYRTLPVESRWGLKPLCLALGATAVFDIYLFADAFLFGQIDPDAWAIRGSAHALALPLIAASAARVPGWSIRLAVSRELAFHTTALAASGAYLLLVAGAGYYVRYFGGEWGRALQLALLFFGLLAFGVVVFSGAQRARLRVFINKHLFPYRYDYRAEWLKFTNALDAGEEHDLSQVTIAALADLVESAGGALWLADGDGTMRVKARLNMPDCDIVVPAEDPACVFMEKHGWVLNLEEYRMRPRTYEGFKLPSWLYGIDDAWLVVPLISGDALIGFVVLLSPRTPFDINWEVRDLLKTAQRQAASYLARMQVAEALIEARKFDAFNRMSAFVVHDLKNLVAQLSLMLKNAERHKDNPEFQADMLETVAHVEQKMRHLMMQLQKKSAIDRDKPVELGDILRRIRKSKSHDRPLLSLEIESEPLWVKANPERLERVIGHVVQNALDATDDDGMVVACLAQDGAGKAVVRVTDTGCGMTPEFVRHQLFKPFQTTKSSGMGIGVFEARQYLLSLGGEIVVDSEPGVGTTMTLLFSEVTQTPAAEPQMEE